MGAAKEARDAKHFREIFDREARTRQPEEDRRTESQFIRDENVRLRTVLEQARNEIEELGNALQAALMVAQHEQLTRVQHADRSHIERAAMIRELSELRNRAMRPSILRYRSMLMPCDNGGFDLIHPGHGCLVSFPSMEAARTWAVQHDGYIKARADYHSFHGTYFQVGFNTWPVR